MNPVHTFPLCFTKIHSNITFHLCRCLSSGLFTSCFPTKILYAFLISLMHTTCPAHLILFHLTIQIIFSEAYKLWSSLLRSLLQLPATSSLLGPNVLLSTLFTDTLNLSSSLSVSNQVQHLYGTTGKILVLNILIFTFLERRQEDKRLWR
jgi:hypothetical protein